MIEDHTERFHPNGFPDDLMNNLTLTDDDQNETIIPGKSTKCDPSQLEVEEECLDNHFGKIFDPQ